MQKIYTKIVLFLYHLYKNLDMHNFHKNNVFKHENLHNFCKNYAYHYKHQNLNTYSFYKIYA